MEPLFFDRDIGRRVPEALALMGCVVQAHRERYPDARIVPDDEWIPEVARDGYIIITHDTRIRRRRGEWDVFIGANARVFVLAADKPTRFINLRSLMLAWDQMETIIATEPAPFMYGIDSRGRLRRYGGPSPASAPGLSSD